MIDETGMVHMQMRQEKRHARLINAELLDCRVEQSGAFGRRRPRIDSDVEIFKNGTRTRYTSGLELIWR